MFSSIHRPKYLPLWASVRIPASPLLYLLKPLLHLSRCHIYGQNIDLYNSVAFGTKVFGSGTLHEFGTPSVTFSSWNRFVVLVILD